MKDGGRDVEEMKQASTPNMRKGDNILTSKASLLSASLSSKTTRPTLTFPTFSLFCLVSCFLVQNLHVHDDRGMALSTGTKSQNKADFFTS